MSRLLSRLKGCNIAQQAHVSCGPKLLSIKNGLTTATTLARGTRNTRYTLGSQALRSSTTLAMPFDTRPLQIDTTTWPYSPNDFRRMDESSDHAFYNSPRFVTHIDNHAISALKSYYTGSLPSAGRILDLCSSWISHLPSEHETAVSVGKLVVVGVGMNEEELQRNPMLRTADARIVQDLNKQPDLDLTADASRQFDAVTCVVSIDYLTDPRRVLQGAWRVTKLGGTCHLVISNRCFPTKAIARWLRMDEDERLHMVGHYLHFSGWQEIEVVDLVKLDGRTDPLWVVRGTKTSDA